MFEGYSSTRIYGDKECVVLIQNQEMWSVFLRCSIDVFFVMNILRKYFTENWGVIIFEKKGSIYYYLGTLTI